MIISKKIRLLPTKEQEQKMWQSVGTARFIYNWTLNRQLTNYQNGRKFIQDGELRKELTQLKKSSLSWLNEVSNNVTKQSVKDCCNAYKNFFKIKDKHFSKETVEKAKRQNKQLTVYDLEGHPRFKSKKKSRNSFYNDPVKLKVKENKTVLLEKIGWIKTSEQLPICKYMNPRITYDNKYWYISIGIEVNIKKQELTDVSLGIDLGLKDLAICSNGKVFKNINKTKMVKKLEKRLKRKQKQCSKKYELNKTMKGGSCQFNKTKNIYKIEDAIKLLHRRLNNIRNNYLHQVTNSIVKTKPYKIVIEDLNVKGMMKNRHLSKAIQKQCFYKFRQYITYKSELNGIELVVANRYFPSSKTCSECGCIKQDLKLKDRVYKCSHCGAVIDRDLNAAINLSMYQN